MDFTAIRISPFLLLLICILAGFAAPGLRAQNSDQVVFHVLHVEETSVYIDVGGNLGLKEGTTLSLFHAESIAAQAGACGLADDRRTGVEACVGYLTNNTEYLRYDQALASGWRSRPE